jgi:acetoin utilization deacetylase AcuC-like enzyme
LIFEYGHSHFDRANRLQRERPARIVALEAALRDAEILARCTTYQTREDILQSPQDYHAVHAPAYLQRLNRLCCRGGEEAVVLARTQRERNNSTDWIKKRPSAVPTF